MPWRALAALAVALWLAQWFYLRRFIHDDAYIALRYVDHWLRGLGLVWNPGERVEGYTSLLWVLLCGAVAKLGAGHVLAARIVGVGSLVGLAVDLGVTPPAKGLSTRAHRASALFCLSFGPLIAWTLGGLETVLFAALVTAGLRRVPGLRRGAGRAPFVTSGLLLGAAVVCRPEGALFFAVATLALALWRARGAPIPRAHLALFVTSGALFGGAQLAFRLAYYGDWLPNTAYVKGAVSLASVGQGLRYIGACAPHLAALGLVALWAWRRPRTGTMDEPGVERATARAGVQLWAGASALFLAYVIAIGGDHMPWYRFVLPVVPLLALATFHGVAATPRPHGAMRVSLLLTLAAGVVSTVYLGETAGFDGWRNPDPAAHRGAVVGRFIRARWPEGALVALNTAGSTAYFSRRPAIDMLGLNDPHIARVDTPHDPSLPWSHLPGHHKGDGAYVLSRKPDFVILGGSQGDRVPWFVGDKQLLTQPAFRRDYRLSHALLQPKGEPPFRFVFFRRVAPK